MCEGKRAQPNLAQTLICYKIPKGGGEEEGNEVSQLRDKCVWKMEGT